MIYQAISYIYFRKPYPGLKFLVGIPYTIYCTDHHCYAGPNNFTGKVFDENGRWVVFYFEPDHFAQKTHSFYFRRFPNFIPCTLDNPLHDHYGVR